MKTQRKYFFLSLSAIMLLLSSCQDVIDIELKDADRVYVVEGGVYEGVDSVMVHVTKTTSYFDTAEPIGVSDATVVLTMPDNSEVPLTYVASGYYKATGMNVTPDGTYKLKVTADGKEFTSSSYMPGSIPIDSLEVVPQEGFGGSPGGLNILVSFQDPLGKSFYRISADLNHEPLNGAADLEVFDDNLNDGTLIRIPYFARLFDPGDTVDIYLNAIDEGTFNFWNTFGPIATGDAGSPFSAAPANPVTNMKGGALGVFGAYTKDHRMIILHP
jgi:Domain of unknown function (DUF4249)